MYSRRGDDPVQPAEIIHDPGLPVGALTEGREGESARRELGGALGQIHGQGPDPSRDEVAEQIEAPEPRDPTSRVDDTARDRLAVTASVFPRRVREAARDIRREMKRDFKGPNWDIVREFVSEPLNELRDRVAEELLRRKSDETLVPIDRDPVPARFAEDVRRYYETLGSGQ